MTTLSPTGYGRRGGGNGLMIVLGLIAALALGLGGGWWFAGRSKAVPPVAATTPSPTCHSHAPSGSPAATTSTAKATGKPTGKPTTKPTGKPTVSTLGALPLPSAITVNVYNATTRKGLAKATSTELAARGFVVGNVANDPAKKLIRQSAEIRFGPAGAAAAKVVAAQVADPLLVPDPRKNATVDFVLGEGYSALATPQQAAATIAALTGPTPTPC